MYGIFTYIWVNLRVNVDTYAIHGAYGRHTLKKVNIYIYIYIYKYVYIYIYIYI